MWIGVEELTESGNDVEWVCNFERVEGYGGSRKGLIGA